MHHSSGSCRRLLISSRLLSPIITELETLLTPPPNAMLGLVKVVASFGVRMAVFALCFSSVMVGVLAMRYRPKMARAYASPISTFVIYLKAWRDVAHKYFVRHAVSFYGLFRCDLESPISFPGNTCGPIPASGFWVQLKLLNESVKQRSVGGHNEKPARALKVKSAHEWPQSGHGLENQWFSCFLRLLQSRAPSMPKSVSKSI